MTDPAVLADEITRDVAEALRDTFDTSLMSPQDDYGWDEESRAAAVAVLRRLAGTGDTFEPDILDALADGIEQNTTAIAAQAHARQLDLPARRTRCRTCGRPIVWAITSAAKRMPVDADPDTARGNIDLRLRDDGNLHADVLPSGKAHGARLLDQPLHTSHFTNCAYAHLHRKDRR